MIILPAIDILGGKPVRLKQGDYGQASQVAASVLDTAKSFEQTGAEWIHMVDLDAAKAGHPVNQDLIVQAANSVSIPVEVGGGIRTKEDAAGYLDQGIARVILGTAALENPEMVEELCKEYPGKIAVSLDAKNNRVMVSGWQEDGGVLLDDAVKQMEKAGVKTLIVTDISKDGMLQGASIDLMDHLSRITDCDLIASGGVTSTEDIRELAALDLAGAITGKAIYSGSLDLSSAIACARSGKSGEGSC